MRRDDLTRLRHMLDSARLAASAVATHQRDDLKQDPLFALGLVKSIEIIGEAAARTSTELRERHPEIP